MKLRSNHIIILVGLVIFTFVVLVVVREQSASEAEGGRTRAGAREPRISLPMNSLNTGVISNKEPSLFEIEVSNTGHAPLQIQEIQGSCPACLSGVVDRSTIPPGRSATLTISIDPYHVYGFESSKSMSIVSNDPNRRILILPVSITVDPEFSIEPDRLEFGEVQKGETVEQTMILHEIGDEPVEILDVQLGQPHPDGIEFEFGPRPVEEWQDPDIPEHFITARLLPEVPPGNLGVLFRIMTNIERLDFGLPAAITADVVSFYTVEPESIIQLGTVSRGEQGAGVVEITGDRAIEITDLSLTIEHLTARVRSGDAPSVQYIDVDVLDDVPEGRLRGQLTFTVTDGENSARHTLEIFGLTRAATS